MTLKNIFKVLNKCKISVISMIFSVVLIILNIVAFVKFQTIKYKNNGYYFFKNGTNFSSLDLSECNKFDKESLRDLNYLFENETKLYISLQFWASVLFLFGLDTIQLGKLKFLTNVLISCTKTYFLVS